MSEEFKLTSPTIVGGRTSHDHYPTPRKCVLALLDFEHFQEGLRVLDPCCGEGQLLDVFRERGFRTAGIELHHERAQEAWRRGYLQRPTCQPSHQAQG